MIKFRFYYDKDNEERFLNEMSKKGYFLKKLILGFHSFEKIDETDYTYKIDLINDKSDKELHDYIDLIEESGAEYVQRWGVWAYFRKKGEFELYTDVESQMKFYSRINKMFALLAIAEFCISLGQWSFYASQGKTIHLIFAVVLDILGYIFVYQSFKARKKMNYLKKQI